ncbi:MAG: NAD(P)/FAD-dependent oxidoreductase [Candidatus Paceibacterota bacterium]|jgi:phytoene dehydrogenase-like protein
MEDQPRFDYLFIGTGNSALTAAALLANSGARVLMLEAHDIPGGYAQSFAWGKYFFCGQVHYIWGCSPEGRIGTFLRKIGLDKDITFELYDPDAYDIMAMPDGKKVGMPYGWERLAINIEKAYPGQGDRVRAFTGIISRIRKELAQFPERNIKWWEYITRARQYRTLIRYRNKTLQDVFDECGLSIEAQTVLAANAGDFMAPPNKLAILAYQGLMAGYNDGAYYPTKHYKYYIDRIAEFIESHRGSRIIYKAEVAAIETSGDKVTSVKTKDGRTFNAKTIICNMDPKRVAEMIGLEKFGDKFKKKLDYVYSPSGVMIYLGLKDIDLKKYGFGRHNIWHCENFDMNKMWQDQGQNNFEKPWIFISTPTLHTQESGTCPPGNQIMEVATYVEYGDLAKLKAENYKEYEARKLEIAERMLDIVEKRYIPDLRNHIDVKVVGTPSTNEYWVSAPRGNAYGADMLPNQIGLHRVTMETPFKNFYFCNASAGYAGMHGTTGNGILLYEKLTGEKVFDPSKAPSDDELAEAAYLKAKQKSVS